MARSHPLRESDLYPIVARWLRLSRQCFHTTTNAGLRHSRIDVVGLRDIGGDLSGDIEVISIEVKRGSEPFATATGQALGYRVYASRIYLADHRTAAFTQNEVAIASHLGVGLIRIVGKQCREELSSPVYTPIARMNAALIEMLGYGKCQLCGSFFQLSAAPKRNRFSNVARENVAKALKKERGLMFWNRELADRKRKAAVRKSKQDSTYERRYLCPDCVWFVLGDLVENRVRVR